MVHKNMIKTPKPIDAEIQKQIDANLAYIRLRCPVITHATKFADIIHFCRMGYELHTNGSNVYLQATWDDGRVRVLPVNTAHDYTSFEFLGNWKEQRIITDGKGAEKRKYNRVMYFRLIEAGNTENNWYSRYALKITYTEIDEGK